MHIDNHTLELYVLGAKSIEARRGEIDAHLQTCEHCRAYADKVEAFYAKLDENLQEEPQPRSSSVVMRRQSNELANVFYNDAPPVPHRPTTRIEKFRYFVRRHPMAAGSGTFALLAGLAMMANVGVKDLFSDNNPSYHHYNPETNKLEIYNRQNEKLWELPTLSLTSDLAKEESEGAVKRTVVADIDADGKNEVLTTALMQDDKPNVSYPLRVYKPKGDLRFLKSFNQPVNYLTKQYTSEFQTRGILVGEASGAGNKEIFVACSNARSPFFLARLDNTGNQIGSYWHFGHLAQMNAVDVDGDGKKELILAGENDMFDSTFAEFPAIVILDPTRVVGKKSSSVITGFGLEVSDAELYYIRLPRTDIDDALRTHSAVTQLMTERGENLHFLSSTSEGFAFEYVFSLRMSVLDAKPITHSETLHAKLVAEGKLKSTFGVAYIENLKMGVRYWDGQEWVSKPTKVRHNVISK